MTISSQVGRIDPYEGNGVTTSFSFSPIVIQDADQLEVVKEVDGTYTTLEEGTGVNHYSVSVSSYPGTGTITYPASGTANILASDEFLIIRRKADLLQEVHLNNQGGYFPETMEAALDLARIVDIQQQDELDRSIKAPVDDDPDLDMTLPNASDRASNFLAFDADGQPIASSGGIDSSIPVSSFVETILDDTSASDVLATLSPSGVTLFNNTDANAADEIINTHNYQGLDDAANATTYGKVALEIADATDGSEDGRYRVRLAVAGTENENVWQVGSGYFAKLTSNTSASTSPDPDLVLDRAVTSSAGNAIGNLVYRGKSSNGTERDFARVGATIQTATNAAEDAYLTYHALRGGSEVTSLSPGILYTVQLTTSGTAKDFTIPANAREIIVMFNSVSLSGTDDILVQLGTGAAATTSGYISSSGAVVNAGASGVTASTAGFIAQLGGAGRGLSGHMRLTHSGSNTWIGSLSAKVDTTIVLSGGGSVTIAGTVDFLRVTRTGTDTMDAGAVNILVR